MDKFLLVSDLHLDHRQNEYGAIRKKIIEAADETGVNTVIDAGDIHPLPEIRKWWIREMEDNGLLYMAVNGNHDYYYGTLAPHRWIYNHSVVGATLWTDFNDDPMVMSRFGQFMSDGHLIKTMTGNLTEEMSSIFHDDLSFIDTCKVPIVVTHHAPSFKSTHPKYAGQWPMNHYFASNLDDFIHNSPQIKVWCHGHMHDPVDYMLGECHVVSNPLGYPHERKLSEWKPILIEV